MRREQEAVKLGQVDVAPLRQHIEKRGKEVWHFHCDIPALTACDRIILRHSRDYNFDLDDIVDWELMEEFRPLVDPLCDVVCDLLQKRNLSAIFVANLPAGEVIYPHVDEGRFLEVPSRVHIPIKTNPEVLYTIGGVYIDDPKKERLSRQIMGKKIHMAEGEVWEIDNLSYHSVVNRGTTDRWHLVVNVW